VSESTGAPRSGLVGSSALLAVGLGVAQVLAYALNVAGARVLGPAEYSELGALLSLIVIGNVVALAVQAMTARRVSLGADPASLGPAALAAALAVGAAALVTVPVLAVLLRLDVVELVAVALTLVPLTLTGWALGSAQGSMRFGALALMYAVAAGLRIGAALVALLVWDSVRAAAMATLVGTLLGLVAVLLLARTPWPRLTRPERPVVVEAAHAAVALLAMFTLTSVDVLVARALLLPDVAGQYAAGAILIKIAFWLPQAVVISAFPRLSAGESGVLRRAAVLMAAVGAVGVALAALLGPVVVPAILGSDYTVAASSAGVFVAAGVVQSLAYLVVYDRLAAEDRGAAVLVWAAVLLLVVLAAVVGRSSALALAWCVVASSAALVVGGAVLRRSRGRLTA
jgi:O-antigen/teichoic acid export membrane protein